MRIIAADIGNSRASFGLFEEGRLLCRRDVSAEGLSSELSGLAADIGCGAAMCGMSCVCASLQNAQKLLEDAFVCPVYRLSSSNAGIAVNYDNPERLGTDRIANVLALRRDYPGAAAAADLGTASHLDVAMPDGSISAGPIWAGMDTLVTALCRRIPHLPDGSLAQKVSAVCRNTDEAIASGAYFTAAGALQMVYRALCEELGVKLRLVLTGGNARRLAPYIEADEVDPDLTLRGLAYWVESREEI